MTAERRLFLAIAALALLGFALRVAAAQGALWLDEAWSAVYAQDAGTPLGVMLNINHDNNHHLNTLWLQLVGPDAPPWLQRGLSILSGTAAVVVAGLIGRRQDAWSAVVAALLFAVSPILVAFGAEARGYAPMVLALLTIVVLTTRWLEDTTRRVPAIPLAVATLLGMLSHLTLVFGLAMWAIWTCWVLFDAERRRLWFRNSLRILPPVVAPALLVIGMVLGAGHLAGTGMRVGNYQPFDIFEFFIGVGQMVQYLTGSALAFTVVLLLIVQPGFATWKGSLPERLFTITAFLLPFGMMALMLGNTGHPRYHLIFGVALLMLCALRCGERIGWGGWARGLSLAGLALLTASALWMDLTVIRDRRADPGMAIDAMRTRAPQGADVAVDQDRSSAVMRTAARSRRYPLALVEGPCPATRFLYVDRNGGEPFPRVTGRCGAFYRPIAEAHPQAVSGIHWKLYERVARDHH